MNLEDTVYNTNLKLSAMEAIMLGRSAVNTWLNLRDPTGRYCSCPKSRQHEQGSHYNYVTFDTAVRRVCIVVQGMLVR